MPAVNDASYTTYTSGNIAFSIPYTASADSPFTNVQKPRPSVWVDKVKETSYQIVFLKPLTISADVLPAYHPIWDEVEDALRKIWDTSDYVDAREDDAWLRDIRSGWNNRLENLYGDFEEWE
jgi:hypothetical protein